jgi:hypothetical protein
MGNTLNPQERLWRANVEALVAAVIDRLDADPSTATQTYAERVAWAAQLLEREARRVGGRARKVADPNEWKFGIDPNRLYTAPEAAPLLGLKTAKTVYRMGRRAKGLQATRTGARKGKTLYRGAHLIAYLDGKAA